MTNNPRGRALGNLGRNASPPARQPGLIRPTPGDWNSLMQWIDAMQTRAQTRDGQSNEWEKGVTKRDLHDALTDFGLINTTGNAQPTDGIPVTLPSGLNAYVPFAVFEASIKGLRLYKDLLTRLDDVHRFDDLPDRVRDILSVDLADLAAQIGEAAIRNTQDIIQSASESFAQTTTTITAALQDDVAGVREVSFAAVNSAGATAGRVTTITARINGVDGGSATIEAAYLAQASVNTGLYAQWTMKVSAGGHFAGIGLAADSPTVGVGTSAIILVAEKFALIGPSETIADPTNPPLTRVPFGYDSGTDTIYINGQVRINAGGGQVQDIYQFSFIGDFSSAPSTTGLKKGNVYHNTTNGNSYRLDADNGAWQMYVPAGATGSTGGTGATGVRGSVTLYASGSSWADATANAAILSATGSSTKVIGDQVTISNGSSFVHTKYWSGSAWVDPGVVIDGNLLVNGTVSANAMNANSITAGNAAIATAAISTLMIAGNQVTVPSVNTFSGPYAGGGAAKVLSTTVTLGQAGTIYASGTLVQGWSAGFVAWQMVLSIDGSTVSDTGTVAGGAFQQSATASGAASVGAGSHTVSLTWAGATGGVSLGTAIVSGIGAMR